jgi:hypothetical protein
MALTSALYLVAAGLAIQLVRSIQARQSERLRRILAANNADPFPAA